MEQLYLTGEGASALAVKALTGVALRPVGFRLMPFEVAGRAAGELLHLLMAPASPYENDLPCRLQLCPGRVVSVPQVYEEAAAPALRLCLDMRAPILLDGVTAEALASPAFCDAVLACLGSERLTIVVAREDAVGILREMTAKESQLWLSATDGSERLLQEITDRV